MAASGMGEAEKTAGNDHFKSGDYLKAAACYTKAIKAEPTNHVYYSNRAQAFLKLNKVQRALDDADKCISLAPDFIKGYHRKALALAALGRKDEAAELALKACEMDATNRELVQLGVSIKGRGFVNEVAARRKAKAAADAPAADPAKVPAGGAQAANTPAAPTPSDAASPPTKALSELTVEEFATEIVRSTLADLLKKEPVQPRVYTQPPRRHAKTRDKKSEQAPLGIMQIASAFDSPETLAQCIPAVRSHVKQFKAQCAAIVVLKSSIAVPRVWMDKGDSWKFGEGCEGIFMQVEHERGRAMWFTHIESAKGEDLKVGETVALDPERFALLPALFK
eukprot:CAMPEP_0206034324 /NCGR_PEP_ID=MMETSP1466-20131121/1256_1 /ASSEMBLY_ACC=CAM_ASM_001126 /TAXON_ID=44452 /ORGANISM="Pavlova gyrans, Strain CCMP608" /LENGTH=336 /DNA_ID=CAMNT_0053408601 /DNA_START=14 /DNA_END=1024 /DNA_ORIENTATION=-